MNETPLTRWIVELSNGDLWLPMGEATPDFAAAERSYAALVAGCSPRVHVRLLRLDPVIEQESAGRKAEQEE